MTIHFTEPFIILYYPDMIEIQCTFEKDVKLPSPYYMYNRAYQCTDFHYCSIGCLQNVHVYHKKVNIHALQYRLSPERKSQNYYNVAILLMYVTYCLLPKCISHSDLSHECK